MSKENGALATILDETHVLHKKGYNCSEATAWALAKYWDLDLNVGSVTGLGAASPDQERLAEPSPAP